MLRISQEKNTKPPGCVYPSEVLKLFFTSPLQIKIKSSAQKKGEDSSDIV
jgi:hypothetical protein